MEHETLLCIRFNEPVTLQDQTFTIQEELQQANLGNTSTIIACNDYTLYDDSTMLLVSIADTLQAGKQYSITGTVEDKYGNSILFVLPFWGYNPAVPKLLISELLTQGSSTHPDAIELYALSAGNLAGCTLYIGSPAQYSYHYIFPACTINKGEYIVLHLKPQGLPEEIDELQSITASGGLDASPTGRDFWSKQNPGALPGSNGAVTVFSNPLGSCIDAVIYSDRTSASDTTYKGFGTATLLAQVTDIVTIGAWVMPSGLMPEAAASSAYTTSTRTLCRWQSQQDTDTAQDWHVVPTKGSTIGAPNTDESYVPQSATKKKQ